MKIIRLFAGLIGLSFILSACSSSPKIHSISEDGVDFKQYKTYAFLESLGPKGEQYSTLTAKYLRESIAREMKNHGFTAQAENSDILVGFNIHKQSKIDTYEVSSPPVQYYGYRSMYGYASGPSFGSDTRIVQYTEGTLNIDLVDRERKQLVWEGVAVGRLKQKPPENLEEVVSDIVRSIFAEYPSVSEGESP